MPSRHLCTTILWTIFLVLLIASGWYKSVENRRDWDRQVAWHSRMQRLQEESRAEIKRIDALLESDRTTPLTRKDLERELNDGEPFELEEEKGRLRADWVHPEYGIPVTMYFDGHQLEGWRMTGGSFTQFPRNAQPPRTSHSSLAEHIRRRIPGTATGVWLAALVSSLISRRAAWSAAQVMLTASLAYGAATVVAPNYNLTVQGIFSNDPMFWAVIMYVGSIIGLAINWPDRRPNMQFTLGHLLLVFTAAAVLLAMGPFGYFAFCVFAVGGVLLWVLLCLR